MLLILLSTFLFCQEHQAICNRKYFKTLKNQINNAQKSIDILGFSMKTNTNVNKKIVSLLRHAKQRGVKVRVLLEGNSFVKSHNYNTVQKLLKIGAQAKVNTSRYLIHAKLAIFDNKYILFGSSNLTFQSLIFNNESNILINSESIAKFYVEYYASLWKNPNNKCSSTITINDSCYFYGDKYYSVVEDALKNAESEITVIMYYVYDKNLFLLELLAKAKKRGVKIKILLEKTTRKAFNSHIYMYNARVAKILKKYGIYKVSFDSTSKVTHSKILIVDGYKTIIGSNNWSKKNSFTHQVGAVIHSKKIALSFEKHFQQCKK
ncbi:phosphatidylserine/phosphatidylglycerophosphate/cardiolipin synthase family protein [Candidatus Uabimicrobium sp. HlEnr_7]|uniref:phospholipase D-like domain-containing protein n=1 Tax=Candidatus Uabimicrobium helgolandensis TaxID=3095367 RepID=UPI003557F64F